MMRVNMRVVLVRDGAAALAFTLNEKWQARPVDALLRAYAKKAGLEATTLALRGADGRCLIRDALRDGDQCVVACVPAAVGAAAAAAADDAVAQEAIRDAYRACVPIGDGWWKKEDPGSGRAYFVHERTGKCQWDPPKASDVAHKPPQSPSFH